MALVPQQSSPISKEVNVRHKSKSAAIAFREFDLNSMVKNPAIVMIAKRGSGKSWVVRAILYHFATIIPSGIIIAPTDRMSKFYATFFPSTYIFYEFQASTIQSILDHQAEFSEKNNVRIGKGKKPRNIRTFIVMDDCLSSKGIWGKDQTIQELLFNGRHYEIMYILTMQFPLGISPELRGNFDYVFLLADNSTTNQKRLYEHYASSFECLEAFKQVFTQLTEQHGAMVLVKRDTEAGITNNVFYYKAPDYTNVKVTIGCRQFNEFHERNYDETRAKQKKETAEDKMSKDKLKSGKKIIISKVGK